MNYKDAIYGSYRSAFKGNADSKSLAFGASKLKPVIELWVKHLAKDSRVMDLGCGAGELLLAFRELGFSNLCGCDLSAEQIEVARSITSNVEVANLFEYLAAQADSTIDVITLFDVIEHLTRQETFELLQIARSKLRIGGLLIGHVPNGLSPFVGHVFYGDPTHEWCPTPSAMKTLLNVSGFSDFVAAEHLGAGRGLKGRLRGLLWRNLRKMFACATLIETGSAGHGIWTRNFAFMALSQTEPKNTL